MFVERVGDATRAVDGRLGECRLVEEHVHEIAEQTSGRAAIVVARVQVARRYEHIVAGHQAHFLVATGAAILTIRTIWLYFNNKYNIKFNNL